MYICEGVHKFGIAIGNVSAVSTKTSRQTNGAHHGSGSLFSSGFFSSVSTACLGNVPPKNQNGNQKEMTWPVGLRQTNNLPHGPGSKKGTSKPYCQKTTKAVVPRYLALYFLIHCHIKGLFVNVQMTHMTCLGHTL